LPWLLAAGRFRRSPLRATAGHLVDQPANEIDHPIGLRRLGHLRRQPILELVDDLRRALLRERIFCRGIRTIRERPGVGPTGKLCRRLILRRGTIAP
jgi:hypothetical protein